MKKNDARMPALRKSLAVFNAGLLMFALVATNFPLIAIAQTTDVAPAVETEVVEEVAPETEEPTPPTDEEVTEPVAETTQPEEPEPVVEEETFLDRALDVIDDVIQPAVAASMTITVTKQFAEGTEGSCEDFSFTIEKANGDDVITQAFEEDCTNVVPVEQEGSYVVFELPAEGYTPSYSDNVDPNNAPGCHLQGINGANPNETCIITNSVEELPEVDQCVILSDTTTLEGGDASVEVSPLNAGWTAVVDVLAKWIWGENPIADPVNDVTEVFTKTFSITDDSSGGTLIVAADNSYSVMLDGNPIGSSNSENNYGAGKEDTILISAAELGAGNHTLTFTVKNWAQAGGTPEKNPAGLKYKLTIDETDCGTPPPPPPQCVPGDAWAGTVEDADQGLRKNGTAVLPARSNPSAVLGASDGSFFSLGFGGSIVIEFDSYIPDGAGDDLMVQEVTNGVYPAEKATVAVSQDGSTWFPLTEQAGNGAGGSTSLDVNETGLAWFRYVKLTDATDANLHQSDADGFDLDAIKGMNGVCEEPEEEVDQCVLVSDTTTLEGGTASALVTFIHNSWTALIQSASWIWGEDPATNTVAGETQTFTKTFWLDGAVASSTLLIAADNSYTVELNGVEIGADPQEKNYTAAGQDIITIAPGDFDVGANTLVFTVNNFPLANGTSQTNPGGLLYKLTIDGTECGDVPPEQEMVTVHIYKHLQDATSTGQIVDNANVPDFPMTATWTTANLNGGATTSGSYVLGNGHGGATFQHAANTSPMQAPADYTTSEVTDGSVVVGNGEQCVADKYRLVGYKWGTSYENAVATTTITVAAPEFTDLTSDRYVIVVNEDCDDVLDDGEPTEPDEQTIVITGNTSGGENQLGWMFNRDTTTQSPFAFLLGNASIGTGSLYVEPIVNDYDGSNGNCKGGVDQTGCDKFIGELFLQEQIADIDSISYDFKIGAPDSTVEEHFYMSVYANFGESSPTKFYDCRYSVVPVSGSTGAFTTVTFDPTQTYPVTTRTGVPGVASPYPCPASPAGMDALSTGSSTIRVIALNVGDTSGSDTGISGYLDKVVVSLTNLITTYDFEPASIGPSDDSNGGGGGGGGGNSRSSAARSGSVLGASTDAACSALLSTFMRMGIANDATEVLELQGFLNEHMGAGLPLTGFFGAMTDAAVHAFQKKYWEDVLKPWFPYPAEGIHDADDSTGYVYKTTQWKINDIYCPDIAPFPPLP